MPGQPGSALVKGQQALLRVEGLVLHRHGAEGAIRQASDQGFPVSGPPEGGHHPPALGGGIQAAAVGYEVPPAHAGLGVAPPLTQQLHPLGRGEVHQPQAGIR